MCKPVLPLVWDEVAHIFWKAKHLATVHHHRGHHHAEEEVAKAEHEENTHQQPSTTKISEPVSVHIVVESFYAMSQPTIHKKKYGVKIYNVSTVFLDKNYPPPKPC